jgi:orotate phosphoribosyltransferase
MLSDPAASMVRPMKRDELAQRIAQAALLRGDFTLRSGRQSSYYLDKYLFTTKPELLAELAKLFAQKVSEYAGVNRLAGAELGGIPLVTATGLQTGLPFVFVRNQKKEYGTAKQLEGELNKGDRVVLLEDVATSGGQAVEAVESLRELGAEVLAVLTVIDRQEGARETVEQADCAFDALFTKADLGVEE